MKDQVPPEAACHVPCWCKGSGGKSFKVKARGRLNALILHFTIGQLFPLVPIAAVKKDFVSDPLLNYEGSVRYSCVVGGPQ